MSIHAYTTAGSKKHTPQSVPILGEEQVQNSAQGYVYAVNPWTMLDRFLILGSEGGTYYVGEQRLTRENATNVLKCLSEDGERVVNRIVEVSEAGRVPSNDPAIFVLALAASDMNPKVRSAALAALPQVCRIPTHLFHFAAMIQEQRGWGRGLRTAVANWYNNLPVEKLSYEVVKYQQRDGWSNRDLLRLAHLKTTDPERNAVYKWIVDGVQKGPVPPVLEAFEQAKTAPKRDLIKLILDVGLTREMVPTEALNDPEVWEALLVKMPITATLRNLGNLTKVGVVAPLNTATSLVCRRLTDLEILKKGRVHPISILIGMKTYASGAGLRGSGTWTPVQQVVDALDHAFYVAFGTVEPVKKPLMLALDISGSMTSSAIGHLPLSCREATAALVLVTAAVEPHYLITGFSTKLIDLTISPRQRLDDVVRYLERWPFGGTDCSLPMSEALRRNLGVDGFVVYTDNETWAGSIHPSQALREYRRRTGRSSKLAVVGITATEFSIADPADGGMLDVAGFDTATPEVISNFLKE